MIGKITIAVGVAVGLCLPVIATAGEVVLNPAGSGPIRASALDQPELFAVLMDQAGPIVDPISGDPVVFEAFVDTGASGSVISYLHATGLYGVPSLGLDGDPTSEFIGVFTELGIGGTEVGDVTSPFGVKVLNGSVGQGYSGDTSDFVGYGDNRQYALFRSDNHRSLTLLLQSRYGLVQIIINTFNT